MRFPITRLRRLRQRKGIRDLFTETRLSVNDFIYPYFLVEGQGKKEPVSAMPGTFRFSTDMLLQDLKKVVALRIPAIILFGVPEKRDDKGTEAYKRNGIIQNAIRKIKENYPELAVITDICLCGYTDHGHCGIVRRQKTEDRGQKIEQIDNDATLEVLANIALSHAEAGADIVAPSAMMDGQVRAIRTALDENGHQQTPIMAYSVKYASSFYSPFRDAANSFPLFGDRKTHQMNPPNREEALREVALDIDEGADIVMVKPALAYLDIIRDVKNEFNVPLAAYNVSGEYAMIKSFAGNDTELEKKLVLETLTSIKRAGTDVIITYFAKEAAGWI